MFIYLLILFDMVTHAHTHTFFYGHKYSCTQAKPWSPLLPKPWVFILGHEQHTRH